jgi:UDP-glucose 4-epimerase
MRLLVTGGAGFIGSHLVDRLLREGHEVLVVDDLSTGRPEHVSAAAQLEELDVSDPRLLPLVEQHAPEVVLHLAAQMDVRKSVADPLHDTRTNVLGTVSVLTAAARSRVRKVVFASSGGTVYGEPDALPVREDAPLRPASPYGAAKVAGEAYVAAFGRLHGFTWTSLRLGNVYGPRQDPYGEAGVVAIFATAMLEQRRTLIFGDGSSSRDYVHVDDVVEAFARCLDERSDGRCFNVGTGRSTPVRQLHTLMARACDAADAPEHHEPRLGELQHIALDSSALTGVTGWRPRVELPEGLPGTVDWVSGSLQRRALSRP